MDKVLIVEAFGWLPRKLQWKIVADYGGTAGVGRNSIIVV